MKLGKRLMREHWGYSTRTPMTRTEYRLMSIATKYISTNLYNDLHVYISMRCKPYNIHWAIVPNISGWES